jgi:aspartyl/glutamyl-tRNA(Asn/Gln) amidotransferase C subunit
MNKAEVLKLATLARIEISDAEAESLSHEFEQILNYVGEVKKVSGVGGVEEKRMEDFVLRNVMRADENPHESGKFTEAILKEAPAREGDYIKVKKIL